MKQTIWRAALTLTIGAFGCTHNAPAPFAAGVFEATEVIVSAESMGRLLELNVEEGQELSQGTVIGKVDCRQLELQRQQLVTRMGGLKTRVNDVGTQTAALRQQIAEAERNRKRIEALVKGAALPRVQLDDIDDKIAVLRHQKAATVQKLQTGNRVLLDERAALEVQRSQLDDQIGRCTLSAPASGTVLVKYAEQGEFAMPGKALFKIAQTQKMFLRAYITADQLSRIKLGQKLPVSADFGKEGSRAYTGRLTWIASKSEFTPKTIKTRDERANQVYAIKVAVDNDGYLKLGMYGFIPMEAEDAGHSSAAHH